MHVFADHRPRRVEPRAIPPNITDDQRRAFSAVAVRAQIESAAAMAVVAVGLTTYVLFDKEVGTGCTGPPGSGIVL